MKMIRLSVLLILVAYTVSIITGMSTWGNDIMAASGEDRSSYRLLLPDPDQSVDTRGYIYQLRFHDALYSKSLRLAILRPRVSGSYYVHAQSEFLVTSGSGETKRIMLRQPLSFEVGDLLAFYIGNVVPFPYDEYQPCSLSSRFKYVTNYGIRVGQEVQLTRGDTCRQYAYSVDVIGTDAGCIPLQYATDDKATKKIIRPPAPSNSERSICWTVSCKTGCILSLTVLSYDLKSEQDTLMVFEGQTYKGKQAINLTGHTTSDLFTARGRQLYIQFSTGRTNNNYSDFMILANIEEDVGLFDNRRMLTIVVLCIICGGTIICIIVLVVLCDRDINNKKTKASPVAETSGGNQSNLKRQKNSDSDSTENDKRYENPIPESSNQAGRVPNVGNPAFSMRDVNVIQSLTKLNKILDYPLNNDVVNNVDSEHDAAMNSEDNSHDEVMSYGEISHDEVMSYGELSHDEVNFAESSQNHLMNHDDNIQAPEVAVDTSGIAEYDSIMPPSYMSPTQMMSYDQSCHYDTTNSGDNPQDCVDRSVDITHDAVMSHDSLYDLATAINDSDIVEYGNIGPQVDMVAPEMNDINYGLEGDQSIPQHVKSPEATTGSSQVISSPENNEEPVYGNIGNLDTPSTESTIQEIHMDQTGDIHY